jgi:hypothetical protein
MVQVVFSMILLIHHYFPFRRYIPLLLMYVHLLFVVVLQFYPTSLMFTTGAPVANSAREMT